MNSPLRSRRFPTTAPDDGRRRRRAEPARAREASAQELRAADIDPVWELVPGASGTQETAGHEIMLKRDKSLRRALALGDVLAVYLALLISVGLIDGGAVRLRWTAIAIAPVLVLVAKAIGFYDRDQYMLRKTTIDEAPAVLNLAVFYALTLWLAQGLLFNGWLARAQVFGLAVASFAFLLVARGVARAVATRLSPPERVVVLVVRDAFRRGRAAAGAALCAWRGTADATR